MNEFVSEDQHHECGKGADEFLAGKHQAGSRVGQKEKGDGYHEEDDESDDGYRICPEEADDQVHLPVALGLHILAGGLKLVEPFLLGSR